MKLNPENLLDEVRAAFARHGVEVADLDTLFEEALSNAADKANEAEIDAYGADAYGDYGDDEDGLTRPLPDGTFFAHEGSALRAASAGNPRNLACPTCGTPNALTPADRACGYQCDDCADAIERGGF